MRPFALALIVCLISLFSAARAEAAPEAPKFFTQIGEYGNAAGELRIPFGVATDSSSGHVYVSEVQNNRVSEFTAWGEFVKAWGWGVDDGSPELQICTEASGCQQGLSGGGPGQLVSPQGLAVDLTGNIYVSDQQNARIQKFDPAGNFLWMAGGGVNEGPNHPGNLCAAAHLGEGDTCGPGSPGNGPGEFPGTSNRPIALGPDGTVYVGDVGRIQKFNEDGNYTGEIAVPGETVIALAVDASGLYVAYAASPGSSKQNVRKLSFGGAEVAQLKAQNPRSLTVDPTGNLYVVNAHIFEEAIGNTRIFEVLGFDPTGSCFICQAESLEEATTNFAVPSGQATSLFGIATNTVTDDGRIALYIASSNTGAFGELARGYIAVYGPPPDRWPPPVKPPVIFAQYAISVNPDGARVGAEINPQYWADTRYYLEYGTVPCSLGGCESRPLPPGLLLTSELVNEPLETSDITLDDLEPGTTYHYRFVTESSGGGPVYGIDPDGEGPETASFESGREATFITPLNPVYPPTCSNDTFRTGAGAYLPDCRAYELVSPVEKGGGDIIVQTNIVGDLARLDQAAVDGGRLTYSSYRAFKESNAAPYTSQYMATRDPVVGWGSRQISPPQEGITSPVASKDVQFKAFTADLSHGWLQYGSNTALEAGVPPGFLNLYRRDNSTDAYEATVKVEPADKADFWPELQGISRDGNCWVFRANAPLTENAAPVEDMNQVYRYCGDGSLELVSVLPDGTASSVAATVGRGGARLFGRESTVFNAVSENASRVYWSESGGSGKLYVRIGSSETVPVSSGAAQFWAAATDGSKAIYSEGAKLFEFELGSGADEVAGGFQGVLGASEDASSFYFLSSDVLDGAAEAGEPNLYLSDQGSLTYIATLAATDAATIGQVLSPVDPIPLNHVARVTPDGEAVVFMSTASLTGYDNIDVDSGKPVAEVYRYDAAEEKLACVSCNPSRARPVGRNVQKKFNLLRSYWAAATISPAMNQLYSPRVLSDDGERVFFNSFDPLAPRDTNAKQDVYQWEASGSGSCDAQSVGFVESSGGCLDLISSGQAPTDSEFADASASGIDVFFKTAGRLVAQDSDGLIDIYDARAGGGFPSPDPPPVDCAGEACQHPPPPPVALTPASVEFHGPGSPEERATRPRCPKGKHRAKVKGKIRCVRNKKKTRNQPKRRSGRNGNQR
jgi:hypothetical protein